MGTDGLDFRLALNVPTSISPWTKTTTFTAADGQGRWAIGSAALAVLPPG